MAALVEAVLRDGDAPLRSALDVVREHADQLLAAWDQEFDAERRELHNARRILALVVFFAQALLIWSLLWAARS
jgi:hypothetical protein